MNASSAWFVGEGSLLIQAGTIWQEAGHGIGGVATREPSILAWAAEQGIRTVDPGELEQALASETFDYLFSTVNLVRLSDAVIRRPSKLAVNFHDGFLPGYAGVNVTVWALLNAESTHGVTWHEMTSGFDEGRILVQSSFAIAPDETAFSLNAKCFTAGIETFRELVDRITAGTLAPVPQNLAERSYFDFYDRPPHAQLLDLTGPAEDVATVVRALDFGAYPNPVGVPKLVFGSHVLVVSEPSVLDAPSGAAPGTVVAVDERGLIMATGSADLLLARVRTTAGQPLSPAALAELGVVPGASAARFDSATLEKLTEAYAAAAKSEGTYVRRMLSREPLGLALGTPEEAGAPSVLREKVKLAPGVSGHDLPALVLCFAARKSGLARFDLGYSDAALREKAALVPGLFVAEVPLRVALASDRSTSDALAEARALLEKERARTPYTADLLLRQPLAPREPLPVSLLVDVPAPDALPDASLAIHVNTADAGVELVSRSDRARPDALKRLARQLEQFLLGMQAPNTTLARVPLASAEQLRLILDDWNATARALPDNACVHTLFEEQARQNPERTAVTAGGRSLSYGELDRRANALSRLLRDAGVRADQPVGIFLPRGVDLLVAVLGIHKAGGAYVPLDPNYPPERVRFMAEDAKLAVVVSDTRSSPPVPEGCARVLVDDPRVAQGADSLGTPADPASLAYVIYTSGSTGKPKGVMVEHRNVVNFFTAMDDVLKPSAPGTWLAVTSLSFDISVLELLWTLTRGFHVVVHTAHVQAEAPVRKLDFSAFYFSSEAAGGGPEHYRLLFEGAKFADKNGFVAVWTPERHFHAFGGLYPNPAVTSAALAMVTERVQLRAGSCVSPLHSPLRIAEEWSLVDNLSNGRAGVSFASGWQPNDFAIRPDSFPRRKEQMFEDIETVRRLWRGERVTFKGGNGKDVGISTLPRPVQKELPIWVTAAGSPETFEAAGKIGANLLTHLLGQTFQELADKVRAYRNAWERAGHPGRGVVSLMLHTFVGTDEDAVRETVRGPMKEYLRSAVGLIKDAAWSFPTFKQRIDQGTFSPDQLTPEEMEAVLDYAFERYYATSGLFGTVQSATEVAKKVRELDVDEIACLIDFGVPAEQVLEHLPLLAEVHRAANANAGGGATGETVPELLERHAVTHFQCTPSMASMLVSDEHGRSALRRLDAMLVGGEAFPLALAKDLRSLVRGSLINVYGPTETTVWSSSQRITDVDGEVPIGRPLANTEILILDSFGSIVPPGEEGELVIGGKGVARGYLGRDELTRERFVPHPLRSGERVYRTGDLACFGQDGVLRFRGRLDHQVKIRGYRIEIGEIEAKLGELPSVREAVVIVREDSPGDKRLVGYVIPRGAGPSPSELREHLLKSLPEYMVPSAFVLLRAFPQTPNKKVDRKALPAPERSAPVIEAAKVNPESTLEETIAGIWRELLNRSEVGVTDNFFDLGGHSLLTVQLLGRLKAKITQPVNLVDLFRFPTIRSLAAHLESSDETPPSLRGSADRGAERQRIRRAMMERRRSR